jgi:hypothetical protein
MNRGSIRALFDQRDLLIAALLVAAAIGGFVGPWPLLRALLVIPLVLFLPGYGAVSAIFPALDLPAVERLLLATALSISVAILVVLGLALTNLGLTPVTWAVALSAFSLLGLTIAWVRRVRRGLVGPGFGFATMPRLGALAVVVAVLVTVNVVLATRLISSEQTPTAPLSMWMVAVADAPLNAELGVHADDIGGSYTVVVSSGGNVLATFEPSLAPQQTWSTVVTFSPEVRATAVVARLYRSGQTTESRFVVLQPLRNAS